MPRSSFAKVVRNRREDLPEGVRPWQVPEVATAAPIAKKKRTPKKKVASVKAEAIARVKKNREARHVA